MTHHRHTPYDAAHSVNDLRPQRHWLTRASTHPNQTTLPLRVRSNFMRSARALSRSVRGNLTVVHQTRDEIPRFGRFILGRFRDRDSGDPAIRSQRDETLDSQMDQNAR
jgi:hypothetical protein